MLENKKKEKMKSTLTSTQEVLYAHEFKMADRAAGYTEKRGRTRLS
ncbi:YfhE family protein [Peribacillus glennii]|uniref:YfhE family protein n=1 Tax=Peribacillus glennii TaxID=2303991 RepID=A0A372LB93_9BACI|nr:YfhE family protein [Peribacillus glennii]RFU62988.1 YfhE family protein [Peribacillus glennii]